MPRVGNYSSEHLSLLFHKASKELTELGDAEGAAVASKFSAWVRLYPEATQEQIDATREGVSLDKVQGF